MAEPNPDYVKGIMNLFCRRYNEVNGTNYYFDGFEEFQREMDFYISDGNRRKPIQYTKVESIPGYLKSKAQTYKVIQRIREKGELFSLKCTISITFRAIPVNKDDIDNLAESFVFFIKDHLSDRMKIYAPKMNDPMYSAEIYKYVSEFEITPIKSSTMSFIISNERWETIRTIDEDVEYIFGVIKLKDCKYEFENSLILLLDMDYMPLEDISLNELRRRCSQEKFHCKEIWQINIGNDGYCDKIYPLDECFSS